MVVALICSNRCAGACAFELHFKCSFQVACWAYRCPLCPVFPACGDQAEEDALELMRRSSKLIRDRTDVLFLPILCCLECDGGTLPRGKPAACWLVFVPFYSASSRPDSRGLRLCRCGARFWPELSPGSRIIILCAFSSVLSFPSSMPFFWCALGGFCQF